LSKHNETVSSAFDARQKLRQLKHTMKFKYEIKHQRNPNNLTTNTFYEYTVKLLRLPMVNKKLKAGQTLHTTLVHAVVINPTHSAS